MSDLRSAILAAIVYVVVAIVIYMLIFRTKTGFIVTLFVTLAEATLVALGGLSFASGIVSTILIMLPVIVLDQKGILA